MNVYLLIDENSPELSIENGAYNVIGVYSDRGQVLQRLESRIKEEKRRITFAWKGTKMTSRLICISTTTGMRKIRVGLLQEW